MRELEPVCHGDCIAGSRPSRGLSLCLRRKNWFNERVPNGTNAVRLGLGVVSRAGSDSLSVLSLGLNGDPYAGTEARRYAS